MGIDHNEASKAGEACASVSAAARGGVCSFAGVVSGGEFDSASGC